MHNRTLYYAVVRYVIVQWNLYIHIVNAQIMHIMCNVDKNFFILSGDDSLIFPMMCLGAHGAISVISNIFPKELKYIVSRYLMHDFTSTRRLHYELLNFMNVLSSLSINPIPIKTILSYMGKIEEAFRLPLYKLSNSQKRELLQNL